MSEVVVLQYDAAWPELFQELRAAIWPAVADLAVSIEHVGSTSVLGLAAKPVIDMDVVVLESNLPETIGRLAMIGYNHRGNLGIEGREAFARPTGSPPHHLYLCPSGSPALANHLAVRDYLRANSEAAREYGELKKRLAGEFRHDIDGYIEGKTAFLIRILRELAFPADALSEIVRTNARPAR